MTAEDYLALIKSLIALCPAVKRFNILREEAQGNKGFGSIGISGRSNILNGSMLFMASVSDIEDLRG